MSPPLSEDRVRVIVNDKFEALEKDLTGKIQDNTSSLSNISGKIDSMYGNGSGRKGMLERIEDKHKEDNERLTKAIDQQADAFKEESKKQASFRHEMRGTLEKMNYDAALKDGEYKGKSKSNTWWFKFVQWGLVALLAAIWEVFRDTLLPVLKHSLKGN